MVQKNNNENFDLDLIRSIQNAYEGPNKPTD